MTQKTWIRILAATAIAAVAIYLRVDGLGEPVTWYDESISALRNTGHSEKEVVDYFATRGATPITDLHRFMQPDPSKGIGDTMRSIITEDAQHTPAYYVLAHYWTSLFGWQPARTRLISVIFSMLALPVFFWLCRELFVETGKFSSELICWIGVTILALSPYNVTFARENREYAMWMFAIILASATFFRALRLNARSGWIYFAAALLLALYTHMLTGPFWIVLAVTVIVRERSLFSPRVRNFALASIGAGLLFLPWALLLIENRAAVQQDLAWTKDMAIARFHFVSSAFPHFRVADLAFLDIFTPFDVAKEQRLPRMAVMAFAMIVVVSALLFARRLRSDVLAFIGALTLVLTVPIFISDFLTGGILGFVSRYSGQTILGWELILTFLFGCLASVPDRWRPIAFVVIVGALAASGYSADWEHAAHSSFQKRPTDFGYVADYLHGRTESTIVTDDYVGSLLSLSTQSPPTLLLFARLRCPSCPDGRNAVQIPNAGTDGKLLYYRSWMNFGSDAIRKPIHDALVTGSFGDPRYHTRGVQAPGAEYFLYDLTPK